MFGRAMTFVGGCAGPQGGLVFVCGSKEGLMQVSNRRHNTDDIIATVLAVEPMKFIYRGRSVGLRALSTAACGCSVITYGTMCVNFFNFCLHFVVPTGISPMGNLGHFPQESQLQQRRSTQP